VAFLDIPDHRGISKFRGINGRLGNKSPATSLSSIVPVTLRPLRGCNQVAIGTLWVPFTWQHQGHRLPALGSKQPAYHQTVRGTLLLRYGLSIDVDGALDRGVSEKLLLYFEIDVQTPQQGRTGMSERVPANLVPDPAMHHAAFHQQREIVPVEVAPLEPDDLASAQSERRPPPEPSCDTAQPVAEGAARSPEG
jgi:hypothetical protein